MVTTFVVLTLILAGTFALQQEKKQVLLVLEPKPVPEVVAQAAAELDIEGDQIAALNQQLAPQRDCHGDI